MFGRVRVALLGPLGAWVAACGGAEQAPPPAQSPPPPPAAIAPAAADDPLGPRPDVPLPAPYAPPIPVVYKTSQGLTVWLLERHTLPIVSLALSIPSGSASDPKGKGGLALATANMLDEGAGTRGAIEFARAIDELGITVRTGATADTSFVNFTVLKRNLAPGFALFGDAVARPRFEPREWKRVKDLWTNDLKSRAVDPNAVSQVVSLAALYGVDHPYGHAVDGTVASAARVELGDVKGFYGAAYRPDRATLVAVGDVTREELAPLLESALGNWKGAKTAPPEPVVPAEPKGPWARVVLVDRPEAPQSVLSVVRPGLEAGAADAPLASRANIALGGSFTSRLNQDLREEHGWSYGARSRLGAMRGVGPFTASAAVFTDKTGDALKALLADVAQYAEKGMTDEEFIKTRMQARSDVVEAFESVSHAAARLALVASLGLPADHEAKASVRRDTATREELARVGAAHFDPKQAVVVVVGPAAKIAPALSGLGLSPIELRDAEGSVKPSPAAGASKPPPPKPKAGNE